MSGRRSRRAATFARSKNDSEASTGPRGVSCGGPWNYHDAAGTNGGVTRVVLRQVGATPGALAFVVEGRHVALGDLRYVLPVKLSLVVDSPTASTGQCGETWVRQALCKLDRSGRTLRCGALPHLFPCRSSRPVH